MTGKKAAKTGSASEVVRVLELEGNAILNCARRAAVQPMLGEIERAVTCCDEALEAGGKIVVTGVGKSGKVAEKIASTLSSTGSLAVFLHPTEARHGDLGIVQKKDVVLALSYTGNTEELIDLIPSFKARGVKIIGMGGNKASRLHEHSDVWIDAGIEEEACPLKLAPTVSTTLALAIGDALSVALMKLRGFDETSFAENHPGGSIGKKLNLRVADLMVTGEGVAVLPKSASIDEVVLALTAKKLGGVLILEKDSVVGLITDGDLRRALKHREKIFTMTASDIMTQSPITVAAEIKAETALRLMEDRASQISVLPVVDPSGKWLGLLRLHDLVQSF